MSIVLRPYQQEAVDAVYQHLRERDDNPCIVLPTGTGKAHCLAQIAVDAVKKWNGRVLILAHVKELLEQNASKVALHAPELDIGVYSAGLNSRDTDHSVIVAGIQSVYKKACELGKFDLVIVDECFPANTLISTPRGEIPIEDLHVGQPVHTALGVGEIEAISARNTNDLMELEFENGTITRCTPNHPFFTEQGWKQAKALAVGENLFCREDMRMLRSHIPPLDQAESRWQRDQLHERTSLEKAAFLLDLLLQEGRKCDVDSGCSGESPSNTSSKRNTTENQRRQWTTDKTAGTTARKTGTWLVCGTCDHNRSTTSQGNAEKLQIRHSKPKSENCNRAGWKITCNGRPPKGRQAANDFFATQRLARVTHIKRQSPVAVFNLQIKGHPSYYASGVLAHNCHLIPPDGEGMYRQFLTDAMIVNPYLRVIGLTATPYRLKGGEICQPENILNHVCYEAGIKEMIVQGYLCKLKSRGGRAKANLDGLHIRGGEFIASEMEAAMDTQSLVSSACAEIVELTNNRKSVLIFTTSVEHCQHVAAEISRRTGTECGIVTGDTPAGQRAELLARFKGEQVKDGLFGDVKPPLKYLANVNVLTTGFDATNVDCVVLLRPTASVGLYVQMVGRGTRLHPGKDDCLILDYGGNVLRHGPVDAVVVQDKTPGNGDAPAKECQKCHALIHASYRHCPECNYEFPPPQTALESTASGEGILSGEITDTDYNVTDVAFSVHTKRGADKAAPKTMRIEYQVGWNQWISEWVCPEHTGWARQKFEKWWHERSMCPPPKNAHEAVVLAEDGALAKTKSITVRSVSDEKFDRVIRYEVGDKPEYYPEPGWNDGEDDPDDYANVPAGNDWFDDDEIPF